MTQPNPNNPSPEMIVEIQEAAMADTEMYVGEKMVRAIIERYLAMQAQQPNPSPADELSDNKLPLIDRLLYTAKTDTNTSVARTAAEAVTALTTLQARLDAVETAQRKYADLQAKARMTPEEVADAHRIMEALAKDGEGSKLGTPNQPLDTNA